MIPQRVVFVIKLQREFASKSNLSPVYFNKAHCLMMLFQRIISVLLVFLGLADLVLATIDLSNPSYEPKSNLVFDGEMIKSTCTASDSHGTAVIITWHKHESTSPALTNTSNTTITSRIKGDTTISVFMTRDVKPVPPYNSYRLYCIASNGNLADKRDVNVYFRYIKESDLPRLRVQIPQNQIVAKGTRRHQLTCQVFSNIDIKLSDSSVDSLSVRWSFGGKTLGKNLEKIELRKNTSVEYPILLQCLTKEDLGEYTCTVNVTMYKKIWNQSATTALTADFPGNIGSRMMPAVVYYAMCLLLLILRNA